MERSAIRTRFVEEGHVVVPGVIDEATVGALSDWVEALAPHTPANGVMAMNPILEPARTYAADPRFADLAQAVLDAPPVCFGASFVVKAAGSALPVLWHQDGYPWREMWGIDDAATLWVAIDPVTPETGGLVTVPGSHHLGLHPLVPSAELADDPGPNVFGWASPPEVVDRALAEGQAEPVTLDPGDVSIHHPGLVHASGPNHSAHRRAVLALRYRPAPP